MTQAEDYLPTLGKSSSKTPPSPALPALRRNAIGWLGAIFFLAIGGYIYVGTHMALGTQVILAATAVLAVIYAVVLYALPHHRHRRFGAANLVTAIRAALVSMIGAAFFFADGLHPADPAMWPLLMMIACALILDGVDGYLARETRQVSDFGARFDMELDALFILFLAAAVYLMGKAGIWVLLIGVMRYLFVLTSCFAARLRNPLPPSFRRKLVCVIQVAALCFALVPFVTSPVSDLISATALVLLSYSFAVDITSLLTRQAAQA
ncbi:CDP-alcohol phosphatidyltransferase family protein [Roseibium sp.]